MKQLLTVVYSDKTFPEMWEFDGLTTSEEHKLPVVSYFGTCYGRKVLVCIPVNRVDYWTLEEFEEE